MHPLPASTTSVAQEPPTLLVYTVVDAIASGQINWSRLPTRHIVDDSHLSSRRSCFKPTAPLGLRPTGEGRAPSELVSPTFAKTPPSRRWWARPRLQRHRPSVPRERLHCAPQLPPPRSPTSWVPPLLTLLTSIPRIVVSCCSGRPLPFCLSGYRRRSSLTTFSYSCAEQ